MTCSRVGFHDAGHDQPTLGLNTYSLVSSDHPVDLGDAITGLDPDVLRRVLEALAHAGGQPLP